MITLDSKGERVIPEFVDADEIEGWENIAKASDIFGSNNFQVFMDKIDPSEILQVELGKCYFPLCDRYNS